MKFLVTGGAGFIGSAVVRYLIGETDAEVVNLDKLTSGGDLRSGRLFHAIRAIASSRATSAMLRHLPRYLCAIGPAS